MRSEKEIRKQVAFLENIKRKVGLNEHSKKELFWLRWVLNEEE